MKELSDEDRRGFEGPLNQVYDKLLVLSQQQGLKPPFHVETVDARGESGAPFVFDPTCQPVVELSRALIRDYLECALEFPMVTMLTDQDGVVLKVVVINPKIIRSN
jgi:hypothetical protein